MPVHAVAPSSVSRMYMAPAGGPNADHRRRHRRVIVVGLSQRIYGRRDNSLYFMIINYLLYMQAIDL